MDIFENLKEALKYPSQRWDEVVLIGILIIISAIISLIGGILDSWIHIGLISFDSIFNGFYSVVGIDTSLLPYTTGSIGLIAVIFGILNLLVYFFILGILINVMKGTIYNVKTEFSPSEIIPIFVSGVKSFVVSICYHIIPTIIILVLSYVTLLVPLANYTNNYIATNASVSYSLQASLTSSSILLMVLSTIFFIVVNLLLVIAMARLSETGSIKEALNIKEIISKIGEIGWGNYIIFLVLLVIILILASFVGVIITIIPIIGLFITSILVLPYMYLFVARSVGTLYRG